MLPRVTAARATSIVRRLPAGSPTRPSTGVATVGVMSQAVRVQVVASGMVRRSAWIIGSTGTRRDRRVENDATLKATAARATEGRVVWDTVPFWQRVAVPLTGRPWPVGSGMFGVSDRRKPPVKGLSEGASA